MALFYLVRHGEPDYGSVFGLGFFGFGLNLAPLTERGIKQVEASAMDERLLDAEVIISSPYTRALQSAAIIAEKIHKKIIIEPELHEWIVDKTNKLGSTIDMARLIKEFRECKGIHPDGEEKRWEEITDMQDRVRRVVNKYAHLKKVIIVAHGMVCNVLAPADGMDFADIIECEYKEGQELRDFF